MQLVKRPWFDTGQNAALMGLHLAGLRPVKPKPSNSILNKAGRLVLYGERNGKPIKIYEAANADHARFICSICELDTLTECFPALLAMQGRFLLTEWPDNRARETPPLQDLVNLMRRIHQAPLDRVVEAGFDYWHDLIKPRFVRAAELIGAQELADEVISQVGKDWDQGPRCLMHPDMTPANLVLTAHQQWKIIDNELLTIGGLPLFDICNTAYALGPKIGQAYAVMYFAEAQHRVSQKEIDVLNAGWLARILGSEFVSGNLENAQRIIRQYQSGKSVLPVELKPCPSI